MGMMKTLFLLGGRRGVWIKTIGLMLLLNLPPLLLAQNPARGIKFERLGLEQDFG
jgi:hypothetical protein